jgi:NADH-quinone oxidoreductase subunit L
MHLEASTEWSLMIFTTSLAVLIIIVSYFVYRKKSNLPVSDTDQSSLTRLVAHKFYVDEIYDSLFVRPVEKLSKLFHYYVDIQGIDGIVNGVGSGVQRLGAEFRKLQSGNIEYYLLGMVAGAILLLLTMWV